LVAGKLLSIKAGGGIKSFYYLDLFIGIYRYKTMLRKYVCD